MLDQRRRRWADFVQLLYKINVLCLLGMCTSNIIVGCRTILSYFFIEHRGAYHRNATGCLHNLKTTNEGCNILLLKTSHCK